MSNSCIKSCFMVDDFNSDYAKFTDLKYERDCDACAFYVGQIGEHVNKLTPEFKAAHSEIIWHEIVGLRNRIVHDYRSVIKARLWSIMLNDIPELNEQCRSILFELNPTAEADLRATLGV